MSQQEPLSEGRPPQPSPSGCRAEDRQLSGVRTTCQPTSMWGKRGVRWSAVIRDASSVGLSLVVARRFEPGAGLAVDLPGGDGADPYVVLVKVVRTKAQKDGSWLLGCEFISALSDEELERVAPGSRPARADDAPAAPDGPLCDVFFRLETRPGSFVTCLIKHLTVPDPWPPAPGATLTMRGGFKGLPPRIRVEVIRCQRRGERWGLRCRLVELRSVSPRPPAPAEPAAAAEPAP